jgi:hypothetical protein
MSDFTLNPAEMAFLLTLVNAKGIPGVNTEHLFPADSAARDALLEQGGLALAEHGHFKLANRQFYDMNPLLPEAIAVLGAPEQIVHTTAYLPDGSAQVGHYIVQQRVVEFSVTAEGNYRVVLLDGVETAARTIAFNLGAVPTPSPNVLSLSISPELLAEHGDVRAAVAAALAESNLPPADGTRVMAAISALDRVAEIDIAQVMDGAIINQDSIMIFRVEGTVGMLHAKRGGPTTLTIPAEADLERTLREGVRTLQALRQAVP